MKTKLTKLIRFAAFAAALFASGGALADGNIYEMSFSRVMCILQRQ